MVTETQDRTESDRLTAIEATLPHLATQASMEQGFRQMERTTEQGFREMERTTEQGFREAKQESREMERKMDQGFREVDNKIWAMERRMLWAALGFAVGIGANIIVSLLT